MKGSVSPVGGGDKIKEMGKKINGSKRAKDKVLEDFTRLAVQEDGIRLPQHYFTLL